MSLHAQDWIEVRSKEEILATLDEHGRLDGMQFMPEMFEYCGKKIRVRLSAHKTCDTIAPIRSRALPNTVTLDSVRCSGAAHGDCKAGCAIFWKEAWLKPAEGPDTAPKPQGKGCTEQAVRDDALKGKTKAGKQIYRCQATDLPEYTLPLRTLNVGQFAEDLRTRNVTIPAMIANAAYFTYDFVFKPEKVKWGAPFRALYDGFQKLWGGAPYPRRRGVHADMTDAPVEALDLKPGEYVRVKSYEEILATLDTANKNRGLYFDGEMMPYCGGVFRVRSRVDQFINEWTGVMTKLRTPAVILENVWCRSHFSNKRIFCPREIYAWWREGWLERVPDATAPSIDNALGARVIIRKLPSETPV